MQLYSIDYKISLFYKTTKDKNWHSSKLFAKFLFFLLYYLTFTHSFDIISLALKDLKCQISKKMVKND